jgi:hypothetical protein
MEKAKMVMTKLQKLPVRARCFQRKTMTAGFVPEWLISPLSLLESVLASLEMLQTWIEEKSIALVGVTVESENSDKPPLAWCIIRLRFVRRNRSHIELVCVR